MKVKAVLMGFFELVTFSKSNEVGRYHTMPFGHKARNHFSIQITPGWIAVQTQIGQLIWVADIRAFIEVMQAQAIERWQIRNVMGAPWVVGQILKPFVLGSEGVFTQWLRVHAFRLEKVL